MVRRYEIRKIIGEGASSTVYKAFDNVLKNFVAIKAFHCDGNSTLISESFTRMNNEIRILQKLANTQNEHIIKFVNALDKTSIILEYCDCSLINFISEFELDAIGIKKIIRMILLALHEMHAAGVIHRDIKLSNILISNDCVKICDFGLSCFKEENDFTYCGTRDYLAPEIQMQQNSRSPNMPVYYDEKIDIFAVGVMYKILLSKKKNMSLQDINTDILTKQFIKGLTATDPKIRPSAKETLSHPIFSDLFYDVPDFKLLGDYSKKTRFGTFRKYKGNQIDTIEVEFSNLNKIEKLSIEADSQSNTRVMINGIETEKILLTNTYLKYYNILCSYFTHLTDRTRVFISKKADTEYSVFANGARQIQNENLIIKHIKTKFIVTYLDKNRFTETYSNHTLPLELKKLFSSFPTYETSAFAYNTDQHSSFSVAIQPDRLVKKCEFIKNIGWAVKEGLSFLILTFDGNRILVKVEEREFFVNDVKVDNIAELGVRYLNLIKQFISRFIQR